ncbi:DUF4258 domain-containing protein, partial [Candidatus Dependentiae bacterium]
FGTDTTKQFVEMLAKDTEFLNSNVFGKTLGDKATNLAKLFKKEQSLQKAVGNKLTLKEFAQKQINVAKNKNLGGKTNVSFYNPPEPHTSTPVFRKGQKGNVLRKFKPQIIYGREYSGHALERMNLRGLTPLAIENTIKNGECFPGNTSGTIAHYDKINNITAITNKINGRIVSIYFGKLGTLGK